MLIQFIRKIVLINLVSLLRLIKNLGGTYTDNKKEKPLQRWFNERWSDIGNKDYPVYRPTIKVSKTLTPLTVNEIDPNKLKKKTDQTKTKNKG